MLIAYRSFKFLPLLLIGFYLTVVLVARVNQHLNPRWGEEIFPFFNWSLFSVTSAERTLSVVRIDSIDGKPLPTPRLYFDMGDVFSYAKQRDSTVWKTIETLADAIQRGDQSTVASTRKLIEDRYMAEVKSADYSVLKLTYDPIKRLQSGEIKDSVMIASFRKAGS